MKVFRYEEVTMTLCVYHDQAAAHNLTGVYKYFSGFSGAGEVYKYFSGGVYKYFFGAGEV